ncbi:ABC-2 type transporter [Bacillus pseudomycoides]|uniref:YhgE/Pip domain-containing protein n=2 Tax=Bacillus pseudomycoides TaxID=64104 RepID=UPI0001A13E75|nr:YhgE/Pip domain-containing protein [Bacillus pseudomycoides]EEM03336.1 ABC-2 type transporter [Bacillus pseudomycoides]PEF24048.1 YhgE/Pip domain-containing protein [Bacillus pseudomycoides]PGC40677.1 YhgE/Pip domain-containing protein [Bacillus pseudomycoides]PGD79178.1 YhgE/Pip domain-containing protein [Bacillus pseudomycoides]
MRGLKLLGKEFATIMTSKKILIPIIAVLFIPVLYAGMFLWAFWDPYDQLDDLPVAVVNLDKGVVYNGKPVEAGKELVDNLKENTGFKWEFVSEKTAKKGMDDRKYYMTIRIPKDFSENTTTLLDANPKKSKLEFIPNESLNFLSSQIGGSAIEKIKGEVSASVTKTYAETMFDSLKDVSKGFADGSEGAGKIHDGTGELKDGSGKVTDGLNTLNSKTGEMQTGVGKLLDGSQKIAGGLGQFVDPKGDFQGGLGRLTNGSKQLADGLVQFQEGQGKLAGGAKEIQKGINDLHGGLEKSSAGVQEMQKKLPELTKGTEGLSAGASELAQGATKWQQKANELSGGAEKTAKGAQGVADGLVALNEQIKNLPDGEAKQKLQATVQQLEAGSKDVAAGTKQVSQGVKGLAGKTDEIQGGATKLAGGANAIHAGQVALQNGVDQLQNGQQQLVAGAGKLAEGQQSFVTNFQVFGEKLGEASKGASDLNSGLNQLSSKATAGLGQLSTGANQLSGGLGELSSGSKQMADGVNQLADGSGKVTEGLGKVNDGSKELATKLGEGAEKTSETKGDKNKYDMFASPVKVETEKVTEVPNYGTGFTPYFLSLGLFVGALLLSIVFPLRETVGIPKSGFSWFVSKFGVLLAVGVIQALVADAVLLLGLGVEVQSVPYFILFSIITSLAFIALVQFLVTTFSDAGRFIAILTLILQLTTSAGTFPLELIPKPLQIFNAWFPMTYSVSGYKAVISSGDYSFMWQNAGILMMFIVLLSLGTIGTLTWMHKRQYGKFTEAD